MFEHKATAKCQTMHETIQGHHAHALKAGKPVTSSPLLDTGTTYQTAGTGRGGGGGGEEEQHVGSTSQPLNLNSTTEFFSIAL